MMIVCCGCFCELCGIGGWWFVYFGNENFFCFEYVWCLIDYDYYLLGVKECSNEVGLGMRWQIDRVQSCGNMIMVFLFVLYMIFCNIWYGMIEDGMLYYFG